MSSSVFLFHGYFRCFSVTVSELRALPGSTGMGRWAPRGAVRQMHTDRGHKQAKIGKMNSDGKKCIKMYL